MKVRWYQKNSRDKRSSINGIGGRLSYSAASASKHKTPNSAKEAWLYIATLNGNLQTTNNVRIHFSNITAFLDDKDYHSISKVLLRKLFVIFIHEH